MSSKDERIMLPHKLISTHPSQKIWVEAQRAMQMNRDIKQLLSGTSCLTEIGMVMNLSEGGTISHCFL